MFEIFIVYLMIFIFLSLDDICRVQVVLLNLVMFSLQIKKKKKE